MICFSITDLPAGVNDVEIGAALKASLRGLEVG
jgi:hypothetical protein